MTGSIANSMMAQPATSPYSGYSQAMNGLLGNYTNQLGMNQSQMQTLLGQQYNQSFNKPKPKWMFDGKECNVRQMADEIWHQDCPEKTHFILKYE